MKKYKRGQIVQFIEKGEVFTGKIIMCPLGKSSVYVISREDFRSFQVEEKDMSLPPEIKTLAPHNEDTPHPIA